MVELSPDLSLSYMNFNTIRYDINWDIVSINNAKFYKM